MIRSISIGHTSLGNIFVTWKHFIWKHFTWKHLLWVSGWLNHLETFRLETFHLETFPLTSKFIYYKMSLVPLVSTFKHPHKYIWNQLDEFSPMSLNCGRTLFRKSPKWPFQNSAQHSENLRTKSVHYFGTPLYRVKWYVLSFEIG